MAFLSVVGQQHLCAGVLHLCQAQAGYRGRGVVVDLCLRSMR
jgi:hypothetical protein